MARVAIPVTDVTSAGIAPPAQVTGDATNDHFIDPPSGEFILEATNVGTSEGHVVTVRTPEKVDGLDVAEVEVTVPKETVRLIKLSSRGVFKQADGKIYVDISSTELKFRAYRV